MMIGNAINWITQDEAYCAYGRITGRMNGIVTSNIQKIKNVGVHMKLAIFKMSFLVLDSLDLWRLFA